jgi:hypothetical protein
LPLRSEGGLPSEAAHVGLGHVQHHRRHAHLSARSGAGRSLQGSRDACIHAAAMESLRLPTRPSRSPSCRLAYRLRTRTHALPLAEGPDSIA